MNRILNILLLITAVFLFASCGQSYCKFWYNDVRIGKHIAYVEYSEKNKQIFYCVSSPCCNSGISLIPNQVLKYKANEDWIIAQSSQDGYYIIDKKFDKQEEIDHEKIKNYVFGGYSLEEFNQVLKEKGVSLNW